MKAYKRLRGRRLWLGFEQFAILTHPPRQSTTRKSKKRASKKETNLVALTRARADVEADLWRLASLPGGGGDDVNAVGHELLMVGFAPRQGPAPGANDP